MSLSRRDVFLGAAALACAGAGPALAATDGSRRLTLTRSGREIGSKSVAVRRDGATVEVRTRIEIAVVALGFTAYRYRLAAHEVWRDGALQRLRAETDDDGVAGYVEADRSGGALRVEGSKFAGEVPGNPGTTSYWSPACLERPVWISTQDGRPLIVTAADRGGVGFATPAGVVPARRWEIGGDLTDMFLYYDDAGEWLGAEFPARGETARFAVSARGPSLTPLWVDA